MYEKIPTKEMSHEDWLKLRKTGIGGADAGAICGLNPFSSPMKVFHDKNSEDIQESVSEALRQGHDLEQYVAQRFTEATGLKVRCSNYMYRSLKHSFMIADVDRLVIGEDAGLECKTASAYNADKWKNGDIPLHYVMQCFHYMAVTGRRTWYIAAVILGQEFVYRKLAWDDALIQGLIKAEENFWHNHIVPGIPPEPDGSQTYNEVLEKYFHRSKKESAIPLVGFDEKLERRDEILKQISGLQNEQNKIEQEIKLYMEDNELAASEKYRVSWSSVDTARLDAKRIRQEMPEIYQDYSKVSTSRRFSVKAA